MSETKEVKEGLLRPITLEEEQKRNPELRSSDLQVLREWADKQPHFPQVLDRELVLFLHSCYYSIEAAKVTADNYFTTRTHAPEFFRNRDVARPELQIAVGNTAFATLPKPTPEGYKVVLCQTMDKDTSRFNHADLTKIFLMVTDLWLLSEGTAPGHVIVYDMSGVQFGHVTRLSVVTFKKFFYYLQEALPFRLKGLHFINVVPFMDAIMAMIRPFLKKEILDVLHLHTSGIEALYKFVPQEVLPVEYGGTAPSMGKFHALTEPRLRANRAYFAEEEKRGVIEEKRPGSARSAGDLFGVEGSFKKLDID